jgi:tRNA-specific 2-thiouridylase
VSTTYNNTVAVAMSGGVDSSTVAAMLKGEGYELIGLTLQLWNQRRLAGKEGMPEQVQGRCCSIDDVYDARRVAEMLGLPYYVVNEQARFERDVVRPFVDEYLAGRTPIPCSLCNNHLKFDQLLLTARQIGADRIATGHYARNHYDAERGRWILSRPADRSKDQTYFLFGLTQEQLSRTIFPLGGYTKPEVRGIAEQHGLALAQKPDSQEICFIPGGDYKKFIDAYLDEQGEAMPESAGALINSAGETLGGHDGIHNFTVGQRKGLGLAIQKAEGKVKAEGKIASQVETAARNCDEKAETPAVSVGGTSPLYVIRIDAETNRVTVGPEPELLRKSFRARQLNWISVDGPVLDVDRRSSAAPSRSSLRVEAKIRHRHEPAPATVYAAGPDEVEVIFDEPQRAVTPGQSAVFYAGDEVVGGGWIV